MAAFTYFEVVRTVRSEANRSLGIADREGVVLGIADDEPPAVWYSVVINDRTYSVSEKDLEPTGRHVAREDIYDGTSIRVDSEGRILRNLD